MALPVGYQPAKVMEPSEKSLDSPTSTVATQRATICVGVRRTPRCGAIISIP